MFWRVGLHLKTIITNPPPSTGSIPPGPGVCLTLDAIPFPLQILAEPQELNEVPFRDTFDSWNFVALHVYKAFFWIFGTGHPKGFCLTFARAIFLEMCGFTYFSIFLDFHCDVVVSKLQSTSLELFMVFSFRAVICWILPGMSRSMTDFGLYDSKGRCGTSVRYPICFCMF